MLLGKPNVYGSIFRFDGQASVFDASAARAIAASIPSRRRRTSCRRARRRRARRAARRHRHDSGDRGDQAARRNRRAADRTAAALRRAADVVPHDERCKQQHDEHAAITRLIDYEEFCNPANRTRSTRARRTRCVVDVREPYEWDAGHIDGARHIPLGELPNRLDEVPRDADIVVYCRSGGRSARALDVPATPASRERSTSEVGYAVILSRRSAEAKPASRRTVAATP